MKILIKSLALGFLGLIGLVVLMGSGVVPGAYNTVENNGTPLTKRSILNFPNSGCVDNSGNASTDCTFLTASTVPANYTQTFTSQTTVILTHNLNTTAVLAQCFDAASPPALIIPNTTKITDANDVTVTFLSSQSGKCQVNGSNGSGGGGGGGALTWNELSALTYQNGWTNFGAPYQTGQYAVSTQGIVYMTGLLNSGTTGTIVTLPAGFRPSAQQFLQVQNAGVTCNITVTTAGVVSIDAGSAGNSVTLAIFFHI